MFWATWKKDLSGAEKTRVAVVYETAWSKQLRDNMGCLQTYSILQQSEKSQQFERRSTWKTDSTKLYPFFTKSLLLLISPAHLIHNYWNSNSQKWRQLHVILFSVS